eukprot:gene7175-biopygen10541
MSIGALKTGIRPVTSGLEHQRFIGARTRHDWIPNNIALFYCKVDRDLRVRGPSWCGDGDASLFRKVVPDGRARLVAHTLRLTDGALIGEVGLVSHDALVADDGRVAQNAHCCQVEHPVVDCGWSCCRTNSFCGRCCFFRRGGAWFGAPEAHGAGSCFGGQPLLHDHRRWFCWIARPQPDHGTGDG